MTFDTEDEAQAADVWRGREVEKKEGERSQGWGEAYGMGREQRGT